jgi:hypothetical protein
VKIDWKVLKQSIWETFYKSLLLILLLALAIGPIPLGLFISPWFLLIYPIVFFCEEVREAYERKIYESGSETAYQD